jgi:glycosyltransferase involved in cell wall biosynthesis
LIPPGDLDGFADAVVKLANNEELRQKFGAAAKENSKRFSPEKISVLWKTMFDSL